MSGQTIFTGKDQPKLEEYKALRAEILQNERIQHQIIMFSSIVTGAIYSWGFSIHEHYRAFIFLIPLLILIISLTFILVFLKSSFTISSYIQVFIDYYYPGMNWESILYKWRSEKGFKIYMSKLDPFTFAILIFYDVFCGLCLVISGYFWEDSILEGSFQPFFIVSLSVIGILILLNYGVVSLSKNQFKDVRRFEKEREKLENIK